VKILSKGLLFFATVLNLMNELIFFSISYSSGVKSSSSKLMVDDYFLFLADFILESFYFLKEELIP